MSAGRHYKKIKWEDKGINIDGEHLSHLIFADDIVLVAKSPEELDSMLTDIQIASKPVGLNMNLSKTTVMLNECHHVHGSRR